MKHLKIALSAVAAGAFVAAPLVVGGALAQAPAAPTSVWDGVFTAEQANRGEPVYLSQCSPCHGPTPDLRRFDNQPLSTAFNFIRTNMPDGSPGSLTAREYSDIIAYLLSAAGFPAGTAELPTMSRDVTSVTLTFTQ